MKHIIAIASISLLAAFSSPAAEAATRHHKQIQACSLLDTLLFGGCTQTEVNTDAVHVTFDHDHPTADHERRCKY